MQPPQPREDVTAALAFLAAHLGRPRVIRDALEKFARLARDDPSDVGGIFGSNMRSLSLPQLLIETAKAA